MRRRENIPLYWKHDVICIGDVEVGSVYKYGRDEGETGYTAVRLLHSRDRPTFATLPLDDASHKTLRADLESSVRDWVEEAGLLIADPLDVSLRWEFWPDHPGHRLLMLGKVPAAEVWKEDDESLTSVCYLSMGGPMYKFLPDEWSGAMDYARSAAVVYLASLRFVNWPAWSPWAGFGGRAQRGGLAWKERDGKSTYRPIDESSAQPVAVDPGVTA